MIMHLFTKFLNKYPNIIAAFDYSSNKLAIMEIDVLWL